MLMCNLLKVTQRLSEEKPLSIDYVGNGKSIDIEEDKMQVISDKIEDIVNTLSSMPQVPPPQSVIDTTLNDDQTVEIMSYLLGLQEKYFSDIPLSKDLCKQFVWNIPIEIYNRFKYCTERDMTDISNPIMMFYAFCMEDPEMNYDTFMGIIYELSLHDDSSNSYLTESWNFTYGNWEESPEEVVEPDEEDEGCEE